MIKRSYFYEYIVYEHTNGSGRVIPDSCRIIASGVITTISLIPETGRIYGRIMRKAQAKSGFPKNQIQITKINRI